MLDAGRLSDRITLKQPTVVINEYGEQQTTWSDFLTCWATVSASGGKRDDTTGDMFLTQTLRCWTRYHAGVTDRMRVVWQDGVYAITNLISRYGDNRLDFTLVKIDD